MKKRRILLPFAFLYNCITRFRNFLYNQGCLQSHQFNVPIICVGNLSVGGTGKSPHVLYLINLLHAQYKIATLSRGYGRTTKGFLLANASSTAKTIGDEPMQFYNRFQNKIVVAVGENRVEAVKKLLLQNKAEVILLDDGFQHRRIQAGMNILLTRYNNLFCDDFLLPAGGLRESSIGKKRAQTIVVTNCPPKISAQAQDKIQQKLDLKANQSLYFSWIEYANFIQNHESNRILKDNWKQKSVILVTGIAQANAFLSFVQNHFKSLVHLNFKDHYNYQTKDVDAMLKQYQQLDKDAIILTTEKDFMRLRQFKSIQNQLYYLPIQIKINQSEKFNQQIINYVKQN